MLLSRGGCIENLTAVRVPAPLEPLPHLTTRGSHRDFPVFTFAVCYADVSHAAIEVRFRQGSILIHNESCTRTQRIRFSGRVDVAF
jgi:hypothetical protein